MVKGGMDEEGRGRAKWKFSGHGIWGWLLFGKDKLDGGREGKKEKWQEKEGRKGLPSHLGFGCLLVAHPTGQRG
jgi:hypothetical protein